MIRAPLRLLGFFVWLALRWYVIAFRRPCIAIAKGSVSRFFLTSTPTDEVTGPAGWYLHRINTADLARNEHNHPWSHARTYVLRGGYAEVRSGRTFVRLAGTVADLDPAVFHKIVAVLPDTWTLFHAGPKSGLGWGFRARPGGAILKALPEVRP